ncbi:DUF221 domain contaning protein [Pseudohyphozyma bogoriensis]|nr:DUF221 domain contaning protein [Pseudohyphozyma bogoriensis]
MATLDGRTFTSTFSGLSSTAITCSIFIVAGLTLEEMLKRLRRYPAYDKRDRGMEGWAMGYLFRARTFVKGPKTEDYKEWPLSWIWSGIMLKESFFEEHAGVDSTVYVRFLRGSFFWLLFMSCTVFPVLIAINFIFSPADVATTSIERASVSSLIQGNGTHLLWVHVLCIWLLCVSWIATVTWLGYGIIRIRRNVLRRLLKTNTDLQADWSTSEKPPAVEAIPSADVGWRQRTVLMMNIPDAMRSEEAIRDYFAFHLRDADSELTRTTSNQNAAPAPSKPFPNLKINVATANGEKQAAEKPLIVSVIVVRKMGELNDLFLKYKDALAQLETAHVILAEKVAAWGRRRVRDEERKRARAGGKEVEVEFEGHATKKWWEVWKKEPIQLSEEEMEIVREGDETVLQSIRPFLAPRVGNEKEAEAWRETDAKESFWKVLHSLDPVLLDRFQPLFKLKHFRGQAVPAIDYWLAKLNLLQRLIEEKRSNPESFDPASTAFVTFATVGAARRARQELKTRPGGRLYAGRVFECKTSWAPEVRDLDWNRLVYVSLSTDIVRGIILQVFTWAATIVWVIPVSFLVGLLSLSSISKYIPGLAVYLSKHTAVESLFSNLLPTGIVALISMFVPTLITILTRKGQTFITTSKLFSEVQARYWKWTIINVLIVFCIGLTAFTSFLNAFKQPGSVLNVIASAFPKGATFFVSWSLLVIGLHHGIEHSLFGIAWINHGSIRKLRAPRKREEEAIPRFFSYHYWITNHCFVLAITSVFAVLNPVVIPFNMAYFAFALTLAHVYYRRWFELNGMTVFTRVFRYSLDSLVLAQVVIVAFLWVLKYFRLGGACIPLIPITVFYKIIGTRYFRMLMAEIDEVEADLICGEVTHESMSRPLTETPSSIRNLTAKQSFDSVKSFMLNTLPAVTLRPKGKLPPTPSTRPIHPGLRSSRSNLSRHGSLAPRSPTSLESTRPILHPEHGRDGSDESTQEEEPVSGTATLNLPGESSEEKVKKGIVTPHPPLIWDDRPVNHLHYDNPALVQKLAQSLWLPRNPLLPLDIGDTIDYHGRALVSSEGGRGLIGTWDQHLTEAAVTTMLATIETHHSHHGPLANSLVDAETGSVAPTTGSQILYSHRPLDGSERIRVAEDVATRVEADETLSTPPTSPHRRGTVSSAGGSSPRMVMARRGTNASRMSTGSHVFSLSPAPISPQLEPTTSTTSAPQYSPTFHRHPLEPKPSPPAIPSFIPQGSTMVAEPSQISLPSTPAMERGNSAISHISLGVPPRDDAGGSRSRDSLGVEMPSPTRITSRARSATLSHRSPSRRRSASNRMSIAEGDEEIVEVSQSAALMSEIIEEERKAHEKHSEMEEKAKEKERKDRTGGWFTKLLISGADNSAVPEE